MLFGEANLNVRILIRRQSIVCDLHHSDKNIAQYVPARLMLEVGTCDCGQGRARRTSAAIPRMDDCLF